MVKKTAINKQCKDTTQERACAKIPSDLTNEGFKKWMLWRCRVWWLQGRKAACKSTDFEP